MWWCNRITKAVSYFLTRKDLHVHRYAHIVMQGECRGNFSLFACKFQDAITFWMNNSPLASNLQNSMISRISDEDREIKYRCTPASKSVHTWWKIPLDSSPKIHKIALFKSLSWELSSWLKSEREKLWCQLSKNHNLWVPFRDIARSLILRRWEFLFSDREMNTKPADKINQARKRAASMCSVWLWKKQQEKINDSSEQTLSWRSNTRNTRYFQPQIIVRTCFLRVLIHHVLQFALYANISSKNNLLASEDDFCVWLYRQIENVKQSVNDQKIVQNESGYFNDQKIIFPNIHSYF